MFDHVGDVFAGLGIVLCPLDAERIQAFEENLFPVGGEFAEVFSAFKALAHGAVVDVAQVHGMLDLVAAIFEVAAQDVGKDQAAAKAQVGRSVQAGAAGIDGHFAGRNGLELFDLPGERVVEAERFGHGIGYEKRGGKIAFAAVGQQGHDRALAQRAGLVQGNLHSGAGAHAYENSFFTGQPAGRFVGRIVVDVHDGLQFFGLEDAGDVTFLHIFEALDFMAFERFDADHADGRI